MMGFPEFSGHHSAPECMEEPMRKGYSEEFKRKAVKLYRESDKSLEAVAEMLGVTSRTLGRWKKQADIDEGRGPAGALTTDEKHELRRLRRENAELQMALELVKKQKALFAARKHLASLKRRGNDSE
jgi:transposase